MLFVAGIDLAAGRGVTEVAVLTVEGENRPPVFDATSHRRVTTDEEIVEAVARAQPSVVAIDAPLTLPRAVMWGIALGENQPRGEAMGAGEGDEARGSPYLRAAEQDPLWGALGIRPLPVSFLGGLTFRAISLLPRLRRALPQASVIEVFPSATLRQLGIARRPQGTRATKSVEASRALVQRGLSCHIAGIALPEADVYSADLLDALAAAYTGVAYVHGRYVAVGDLREGVIVVLAREGGIE